MTEFEDKLLLRFDKIIQLLEFKNDVTQGFAGHILECTCHKKGRTTADEPCPIHG